MGAGFIRRFKTEQGTDVYKEIEGVTILDLGGPRSARAPGSGVVGMIGEFPDMRFAVAVDSSGNVTTSPQLVEIFGADDFAQKLGGFDSTIGDIGGTGGNGFLDLDGVTFRRLVVAVVNLASSKGIRVWRKLPTNKSATDPTPVVPIAAGIVEAGREFRYNGNRVRLGTRVTFMGRDAYLTGIDGSVTAVAGNATAGSATSAAGPFVIRPGYVTHISIDQGANQVWTWGGTAAKCKMAAAGAYAGSVSGTFDVQWADQSGTHTNTITIDGTVAAGELALLARLNEQLSNAGVPVFAEDSGDANKIRFVSTRYGTSTHVEITAVTGAGFTAETGIDVTSQTTAPAVSLTKTGGSGAKSVTIPFLDAATSSAIANAIVAADGVTGGTLVDAGGNVLTLTTSATGASPNGVQVKSTSTARLGFDTAEHNGTAAGAGGGAALTFTSAGGDFVNNGVAEGDILVTGVIDAAGAQGANALTLRVKSVDSATALTVEMLDGSSFNWTTGTGIAWRLHLWDVADSGKDHQFSEAGGYLLPARPLDATIAAGTLLAPTVAPEALTASSADPISGLGAAVHPGGSLTYTAAVQGVNATTASGLEALYQSAIDAFDGEESPASEVTILFASRSSQVIDAYGLKKVRAASDDGHGRMWLEAPPLTVYTADAAGAGSYPGVGFQRNERAIYSWPGVQVRIAKAVNVKCKTADGNTTTSGVLDVSAKSNLASMLSLLNPERNPGEATDTTSRAMARVLGPQRGVTTKLTRTVYTFLKARGICALRMAIIDGATVPIFQSGVTTSLATDETAIHWRRMRDYIQDAVAAALVNLSKQPITPSLREEALRIQFEFLNGLYSPNDPKLRRIEGFAVTVEEDPALAAQDILATEHRVRLLGMADAIVLRSNIGPNVETSVTAR